MTLMTEWQIVREKYLQAENQQYRKSENFVDIIKKRIAICDDIEKILVRAEEGLAALDVLISLNIIEVYPTFGEHYYLIPMLKKVPLSKEQYDVLKPYFKSPMCK